MKRIITFLLLLIMFLFPVTDIDSKTISFTQLWEHANLHNEGTSIFKPEIIEHQGYIYANYGNVLYVFQQSTGKDLFSYIPIIDGDLYLILNIEIYGKALYAFIINNEAIKGSNRYNMKFFFFKLNIENFKIDWIQKCQYAYTRSQLLHIQKSRFLSKNEGKDLINEVNSSIIFSATSGMACKRSSFNTWSNLIKASSNRISASSSQA